MFTVIYTADYFKQIYEYDWQGQLKLFFLEKRNIKGFLRSVRAFLGH